MGSHIAEGVAAALAEVDVVLGLGAQRRAQHGGEPRQRRHPVGLMSNPGASRGAEEDR